MSAMIPGSADADFEVRTRALSQKNLEFLVQCHAAAIAVGPEECISPTRFFASLNERVSPRKSAALANAEKPEQYWTLYKHIRGQQGLEVMTFPTDSLWRKGVQRELESKPEDVCLVFVAKPWVKEQGAAIESLIREILADSPIIERTPRARPMSEREALLRERRKFLERVGTLTSEELATGGASTSPNASQFAADQRARGAIFGVRFGQQWLYPSFQFDETRRIRPEMREIVTALSPDDQGWDRLQWFLEPHQRLGGHTPLEVWTKDPKEVLKAAQSEHWNGRD